MQNQDDNNTLLCTFGDCENIQSEENEFCDKHNKGMQLENTKLKLTKIQEEAFNKSCPNCKQINWAHVIQNTEETELYLWCHNCEISMDSDGGFIA